MAKNIVLIGMMGCGKTTVGRFLAQMLSNRSLADTDALIEQQEGRPIPSIFAREGEARFRELELELCRELSGQQDLIIACGGGLPLQDGAIAALKQNGLVFWLDRDPGNTYDNLDLSSRPLAQAGRGDFLRRYQDRAPIYKRWADCRVPCRDGPGQLAKIIAQQYKEMIEA